MTQPEAQDSRLKRGPGRLRQGRGMRERSVTGNREMTDAERLEAFRMQRFSSQLPDPPYIDGYHTIWLTTKDPSDSIARRLGMGYELVKADEIPGWEHAKDATGSYPGCICINEMVLGKLKMDLFKGYMAINHHELPLEEASKMSRKAEEANAELQEHGTRVMLGKGTRDLTKDPGSPDFGRFFGEAGDPYPPHYFRDRRRRLGQMLPEDFEEDDGDFV